jgi:hypothetical protein
LPTCTVAMELRDDAADLLQESRRTDAGRFVRSKALTPPERG